MSFFAKYGSVWFTTSDGKVVLINDLTKFASLRLLYQDDPRLHLKYKVKDGERPEILAYRLYGDVSYWWVVLLANNIFDLSLWPMDSDVLDQFIDSKYIIEGADSIHHYVDLDGNMTDPLAIMKARGFNSTVEAVDFLKLKPVTNREYETEINEARRNIILIDPDKLGFVIREIANAFQ